MDSEIKREMSFLRSLSKAVIVLPQNMCAYLRNEFEKFSDIYERDTVAELHTDPAFISYIKGEETEPGMRCSRTTLQNVESCRFKIKKTVQEENSMKAYKRKKNASTSKKRNKSGNKTNLRMSPPPVEELVFRKESVVRTETVNPCSTEVSRQVPCGQRKYAADHTSHGYSDNFTLDSASKAGTQKQWRQNPCQLTASSLR